MSQLITITAICHHREAIKGPEITCVKQFNDKTNGMTFVRNHERKTNIIIYSNKRQPRNYRLQTLNRHIQIVAFFNLFQCTNPILTSESGVTEQYKKIYNFYFIFRILRVLQIFGA